MCSNSIAPHVGPPDIFLTNFGFIHRFEKKHICTGHVWFQDLAANVEIFNTYGEFSNDKLLQDYGFILESSCV